MSRKGNYLCPACGKDLAPLAIHGHTEKCAAWRAKYGAAFPYLKFNRHPEQYEPEAQEGIDYVQCKECLAFGWDFRFRRMLDHITGLHKLDEATYAARHPGAPIRLKSTLAKRKATTQEHYGVDNVFQAKAVKEASKETMLDKYGDTCPMRIAELKAKAAATNLERYGAENPFGSAEIQEKIKQSNFERFGVQYPNQCPEVMGRRVQTNLERFGTEHYFETAEFQDKFKQASLVRFGTDHPMQSEEGKRICEDGCMQAFGAKNPLSVPSIQAKAQATLCANHGGVHPLSDPAIIEARKRHLLEKYGVDNISKVPAIKEKIIAILLSTWGNAAVPGMNNFERAVSKLLPENVIYTGDWTYWVTWVGGRRKNPDFVVLTSEQLAAYKAGTPINDLRTHLVIEVNGDFWHTKHKGFTHAERNAEFINGYASIGIACLVIWESELKADSSAVEDKLAEFYTKHEAK